MKRVFAFDAAGQSSVSPSVTTVLARYTVDGQVYNIAHQLLAATDVSLAPAALTVERRPGGYQAFLADGGNHDVTAGRAGFGTLPAMQDVPVMADVSGLDFVLPPLDDIVSDGGFESGGWGDWVPTGNVTPTLGHTGNGAVVVGRTSQLSQPLSVPGDLTDATLSFLVRLEDGTGDDSELQVELEGTSISHTQVVSSGEWRHVWLPVDAALGQAVTLTFSVSDASPVRLDEVSVGSVLAGDHMSYLPTVHN